MYDSPGAILALCGITPKQWKFMLFLQCARWEPGHSTPKTLKIVGKTNNFRKLCPWGLDGRPVASHGRRWDLQGDMQKPLGKRWFPVCANIIPGAPVPSWSEQDRSGHTVSECRNDATSGVFQFPIVLHSIEQTCPYPIENHTFPTQKHSIPLKKYGFL